ncbi:MAG TPA: HDOD domain-containing protein [Tepidiformaceae bacterium]
MVAQSNTPGSGRKTREQIVAAVESLPPLPAVAFRVVATAQDPKSSAKDLALVVSSDPGLTAKLLRIVNSAAFARRRQVSSIQEALVLLGFIQARNIAVASAIAGTYPPDPGNALFRISTFWRHSLAVAFLASEAAARTRVDPPTAFTTGVIHNIGRLAIFNADPAGLDQAVVNAITEDVPLETIEHETLGYDHAEIGGLLAAKWGLPEEMQKAITSHHANPGATPLTKLIADADRLCVQYGILPGYVVPEPLSNYTPRPLEMERLLHQVDELINHIVGAPEVRINYI